MSVLTTYAAGYKLPTLMSLAKQLIFFGLICLMLCVPVLNKCFWIAIFLILASGSWLKDWKILLKDKVILTGILLALTFTIGVLYSQASWNYSLRVWDKYLKICYLLFFLPFFTQKKARHQALLFFLLSVMISEIFAYLHYFNIVNLGFPSSKHWLFVQDIDSGFIVSFAAYLLVNFALDNKKFRTLSCICFLVCTIDVLFLNQERTGYLIYLGLTGLLFLQRFRWKGLVSALLVVPLLFASIYFTSSKFQDRINQVATNITAYQQGNKETSIGLRLTFAEYSLKVIKEHLLFGSGTGSFEEIYRSMNGPKINNATWPAHPHNEYVSILFQLGVVGLTIFIYWIYLQLRVSFALPNNEKLFLQGLIVAFLLLSFCNASLLVNPAGACYVLFLAVFMASKYDTQRDFSCE